MFLHLNPYSQFPFPPIVPFLCVFVCVCVITFLYILVVIEIQFNEMPFDYILIAYRLVWVITYYLIHKWHLMVKVITYLIATQIHTQCIIHKFIKIHLSHFLTSWSSLFQFVNCCWFFKFSIPICNLVS